MPGWQGQSQHFKLTSKHPLCLLGRLRAWTQTHLPNHSCSLQTESSLCRLLHLEAAALLGGLWMGQGHVCVWSGGRHTYSRDGQPSQWLSKKILQVSRMTLSLQEAQLWQDCF